MNPFVAFSVRQQKATSLWNPAHWGAVVNSSGNLELDGVDLPALVAGYGSPLLAVSRQRLLSDAARFTNAVRAAFPDATIGLSYKTNCIPGVLRELHAAGFAAEVISPYELWLAAKLGLPGARIIVNGVNKDADFLREAVRLDVSSINIDEPRELDLLLDAARQQGRPVRVSLRLKVDGASHFGLGIKSGEAAQVAGEIAKHPDLLDFQGLHFHALADNDDPEPHVRYLRKALDFAARIRATHKLSTATLNVGGGYTVPTMKVMSRFEYARQRLLHVPCRPPDPQAGIDISDYMQRLAAALDESCRSSGLQRPRLAFEPGRIVFSQSHVMLSKVHSIKRNAPGADFAMTDAGKILTSYPCDYEYHQMFVANRMRTPCSEVYQLMGRLCTSADWLAKNRCLPPMESGDVIAVMDAGAYFTSYASNFAFPRPAVVMLDAGQVQILRQRESFEHLTAMDDWAKG